MVRDFGAVLLSAYVLVYSYASECEVSQWQSWEECLGNCNFAMRVRNRDVSRPPFPQNRHDGKLTLEPCPVLYQVQQCVLDFCQSVANGNETSTGSNFTRNAAVAAGSQVVDGMSKDPEFRGKNFHKFANNGNDDDDDAVDVSPSNAVVVTAATEPRTSSFNNNLGNNESNVSLPSNASSLPSDGNSLTVIRNVDQSESSNALETVETSARLPNPGNFLLFAGLPGRPVEPRVINLDNMPLPGPFPLSSDSSSSSSSSLSSSSSSFSSSSTATPTTAAKFYANITGGDIFDETPAKILSSNLTTKSLAQILDDHVTTTTGASSARSIAENSTKLFSTTGFTVLAPSISSSQPAGATSFTNRTATDSSKREPKSGRSSESFVLLSSRSPLDRSWTIDNNRALLESAGRGATELPTVTRGFSAEPSASTTQSRSKVVDQQPPISSKLIKGPCGSYNENKRCCKLNHRNKCPDGKPAQMVLRWFRFGNQTECGAYNYGYCGYEIESQDNPIKFEEECYDLCYTDEEHVNMPVFRGLKFHNGFRLLGQQPSSPATENTLNNINRKQ